MISKYYNLYTVSRFIAISKEIVEAYKEILKSPDIRQAYTVYIGARSCKICDLVSQFKISCKAACPFYVIWKTLCVDQPSYNKLAQLCEPGMSRNIQLRILQNRIKLHEDLQKELLKIKNELETKK